MIGIGITTRNRPEVLQETLNNLVRYLPKGGRLAIVDDASDTYAPAAAFRFNKNVGIARAKNKCLELLQDCDHIFLFDDDCYPIAHCWWKPYVESTEPHLMYQFKLPSKPASDMCELYRDDKIVAYSHTRGAMIYIKREVLDVVGGMDTAYGEGMFEHPDWTNRIHNAGLTTHRAMDVPNSSKLIYCLDQDAKVDSSIPREIRRRNRIKNAINYQKSKTSKEYKEFRA